jgi:ABC-type transport system involved in cytochrome c biogenesis permease subunit
MLLAGLITLLFGQQGLVELRNGESSRTFWTQERYLELGAESRAFDPHPWARPVRIEHEGTSVELRRDPDAGPHAVILSVAGREQRLVVPPGPPRTITSDDGIVLRYGSRSRPLPFRLTLERFELETYPGTQAPASYASRVLVDGEAHVIHLNDPLRSGTLRIFQASYVADQQGSVFTVNDDPGAPLFYLASILLFGSLIAVLVRSRSRFGMLRRRLALQLLALAMVGSSAVQAQTSSYEERFASATQTAAEAWGRLTVQARTGRTQPVDTLSREILRKLSRRESWDGLSASQVVLGIITRPQKWQHASLISVNRADLREALGAERRLQSLSAFFTADGEYRLRPWLHEAHATAPGERSAFQQELLRLDERIVILQQLIDGRILHLIPEPDKGDSPWLTPRDYWQKAEDLVLERGLRDFFDGGFDLDATRLARGVEALRLHQERHAGRERITGWTLELELLRNRLRLFSRLAPILMALGVLWFALALVFLARGRAAPSWLSRLAMASTVIFLLASSLGIVMRWLVSGTPPLTSSYENMIYIGWSSLMAALWVLRTQLIGIAGGQLLAGFFFLGAHLSHLDPEITVLMPVLKSSWLLIHVTVITASYGLLGLCACVGLGTLILCCLHPRLPRDSLARLSAVNELTMLLGLSLLVIGTFLGAFWASESWGRYWAWDPKETWALISILVYVVLTHLRLWPKLDDPLLFATGSLWGYSSILMTYFGVNYYLTGKHAYAGGSPVPLPTWMFYSIAALALLTLLAWLRRRSATSPVRSSAGV